MTNQIQNPNFFKIKKLLPGIKTNVYLRNHTTFNIGGPARFFFEAQTKKDLIRGVKAAVSLGLPFFILGKGSNVLASDEGYRGLVIKIKNQKLKVKNYESRIEIICEAGVTLKDLVTKTKELGLTGLEWAAGIPGTIGGAVRGNAGAFGKSIGNSIKEVEVLEIIPGTPSRGSPGRRPGGAEGVIVKKYSKEQCNFNYRSSIFKEKKNLIISSASFEFEKGDKKEIEKKIKENLDYRKKNHPLNFPSAGSVFKNPPPPSFGRKRGVGDKSPFISAAELIDKAGLKGKKIGRAQISEKHCNFIINLGGAKAEDVKALIKLIKKEVKKKFGIELEEEIEFINI